MPRVQSGAASLSLAAALVMAAYAAGGAPSRDSAHQAATAVAKVLSRSEASGSLIYTGGDLRRPTRGDDHERVPVDDVTGFEWGAVRE